MDMQKKEESTRPVEKQTSGQQCSLVDGWRAANPYPAFAHKARRSQRQLEVKPCRQEQRLSKCATKSSASTSEPESADTTVVGSQDVVSTSSWHSSSTRGSLRERFGASLSIDTAAPPKFTRSNRFGDHDRSDSKFAEYFAERQDSFRIFAAIEQTPPSTPTRYSQCTHPSADAQVQDHQWDAAKSEQPDEVQEPAQAESSEEMNGAFRPLAQKQFASVFAALQTSETLLRLEPSLARPALVEKASEQPLTSTSAYTALPGYHSEALALPIEEADRLASTPGQASHRAKAQLGKTYKAVGAVVPSALKGLKHAFSLAQKAKEQIQNGARDMVDFDERIYVPM